MHQILKLNTITAMFLNVHETECQYCNSIFNGADRQQALCPTCIQDTEHIQHVLQQKIQKTRQDMEDTKIICRNCIDYAGFPDMEIERCTKCDCEVYEKRSTLNIDTLQATKQLDMIRVLGTRRDDSGTERSSKRQRGCYKIKSRWHLFRRTQI